MIKDIVKTFKYFENVIQKRELDKFKLMNDLFHIIRVFYIKNEYYSKNLCYILIIFLLNKENEVNSYIGLNYFFQRLSKFYLDNNYRDSRIKFFNRLLENYFPKIYQHLKNLDISSDLYFIDWYQTVFSKYVNYVSTLRIFDMFLLNGEIMIFKISLNIIKTLENDLLSLTVSEILDTLKKFPKKYGYKFFTQIEKNFNINEEYTKFNVNNEIAKQKKLLNEINMDFD